MPRVSVILCSYNQAPYVAESVESVLAQTFEDWELIAIDNGSDDGSQDILRAYESPKVRTFLHAKNAAVSRRFNEGIAAARGEFVAFLYSDDCLARTKLERQVAELDRRGPAYGVAYGRAEMVNESTGARWFLPSYEASGPILPSMLQRWGLLDMLAPLARTECFRRYPFYEDIFAEGEASFLKLAMTYSFAFIDEPAVLLRDHLGNRGKAIRKNAEMTRVCIQRLGRHPDFPPQLRVDLDRAERTLLRGAAWSEVRLEGDQAWARRCFREAVAMEWREAFHPKVVGGVVLSFLPRSLRHRANRLGFLVRRTKGNVVRVDGYGGASES